MKLYFHEMEITRNILLRFVLICAANESVGNELTIFGESQLGSAEAIAGNDYTLTCVSDDPIDVFKWIKNDFEIGSTFPGGKCTVGETSDMSYKYACDNKSTNLTISGENLTCDKNNTIWTCKASLSRKKNKTFTVKVPGYPVFHQIQRQRIYVKEGDKFNISVHFASCSIPNQTWVLWRDSTDYTEIDQNGLYNVSIVNTSTSNYLSTITKESIQPGDFGLYILTVVNSHGMNMSNISIVREVNIEENSRLHVISLICTPPIIMIVSLISILLIRVRLRSANADITASNATKTNSVPQKYDGSYRDNDLYISSNSDLNVLRSPIGEQMSQDERTNRENDNAITASHKIKETSEFVYCYISAADLRPSLELEKKNDLVETGSLDNRRSNDVEKESLDDTKDAVKSECDIAHFNTGKEPSPIEN